MTIILTGGGSGGHITPLLAVAHKLKQVQPKVELVYIGERNGKFASLTTDQPMFKASYSIRAGKFRRYHGDSWLKRLFDIKTNVLNLRDAGFAVIGFWQSLWLLRKLKPSVVFIKGGFVGVPVGLSAAVLRIPYVTHDSDALPGLANRLIARWATVHAVGLPKEFYKYPPSKTEFVGIPLTSDFQPITAELQDQYRQQIGLAAGKPLLLVTGGSLGAQRLNQFFMNILPKLLETFPDLQVVHQVGKGNLAMYEALLERFKGRLQVYEFIQDLHRYSGAADVIVGRAGATMIAEFAVQGKACILVPNPQLTDGHQTKNAQHLAQAKAAIILEENTLQQSNEALLAAIASLLESAERRQKLGQQLTQFAQPNAAEALAQVILRSSQDKSAS